MTAILAALLFGIFPSFIAYLAWNEGVRRDGPNGSMAFFNMLSVFGVLLGALLLSESIQRWHLFCGSLVIIGSLVSVGRALFGEE